MAMIITAFLASTALGAPVEKVARRPSLFGKLGSHIANATSVRHFDYGEISASPVQSGTCSDIPPQTLSSLTGGEIPDCRTFVGIITAAGISCDTDLGQMIPQAVGHTAAQFCCATCAAGGGSDPVTAVCDNVQLACLADLRSISNGDGTGKCDGAAAGCDKLDPTNTAADATCIACVERAFGADYRPCSCCIIPILTKLHLPIDADSQAALEMIFPCRD